MLSSWELKLVWRYQICGRFGGQCPVFGATRCGMPGLVGKNGGFFTCKRPRWCGPGGIGKEVKFWLVLVPTKNCPDSCIETHAQVLDCPSNVHCGWAPFLRCWTDFGCQEKQVGSLLGGSYPLLARIILAGNLQAWVGVVCTPPLLIHVLLVHNVYLIFYRNKWCVCSGWSLTTINSNAV